MVSAEDFVRAWQAAKSIAEVMKLTGMTVGAVYARACDYRKKGVPLKSMMAPGGRNPLDYKALADLANSLNGQKK